MSNRFLRMALPSLLILIFTAGCAQSPICFQPCVEEPAICLANARSCFPELTPTEAASDWGKELKIGLAFARDFDLYRAITAYKRALVLMPDSEPARKMQAAYELVVCYYLGKKYQEAANTFEDSTLTNVKGSFPAFRSLIIILEDCYRQLGREEKANQALDIIQRNDPETALDIKLSHALRNGDEGQILELAEDDSIAGSIENFQLKKKSPSHAKALQAIIPGAGYLYVGQKQTALTSFIVNSLFIWAAYSFFDHGNVGAGLFTLSLEAGWYFGGINGAGLAANEYNEAIYQDTAYKILQRNNLFPVMMLECVF